MNGRRFGYIFYGMVAAFAGAVLGAILAYAVMFLMALLFPMAPGGGQLAELPTALLIFFSVMGGGAILGAVVVLGLWMGLEARDRNQVSPPS